MPKHLIIKLLLTLFIYRLAVLRKWRSKHGPTATYRNLAKCFYNADRLDMVETVCQALGAPSSSDLGQQLGILLQLHIYK